MDSLNLYGLLGVPRNATSDQIKKAYKKKVLIHHPDKGGDEQEFKKISKAIQTLLDDKKRAAYDHQLKITNSRDGLGVKVQQTKKASARHQRKQQTVTPTASFAQIPQNPQTLSIRELKLLLTNLGIRHDDCFEKADLLQKLKNRKKQPKRSTTTTKTSPKQKPAPKQAPPSAPKPSIMESMTIKILSIGDPQCGKSCIIKRYCQGRFVQRYISTIGVDYGVKKMSLCGKKVNVNFFDLSGQRDYAGIRQDFYKDSQGVILVFEVHDQTSFSNLVRWEREARSNGLNLGDIDVIVCGNKIDTGGRQVSAAEANKFASSRGYKYFQTSASSGAGISQALDYLFTAVVTRVARNKEVLLRNLPQFQCKYGCFRKE